jgi:hypothetical protein
LFNSKQKSPKIFTEKHLFLFGKVKKRKNSMFIQAEVVTFVAGSLEAGGLPGYPEVF